MVVYKQIPNLPVAIALGGLEELEVVQGGTSVRTSINQLSALVVNRVFALPMPPTGAAGGDLTGAYPNPQIRPGLNGQVLTTVANVAQWSTLLAGGTVTSVSVVSANGLAGTVATPTSTPAITLSTTITGMLKGDGTAISAATAGTDYMTPGGVSAAYQPLDGGLTALSSIGTGLVTNTAADTFIGRTITGTLNRVTVANGNGVAGNPTLDISATYDALWAPVVHNQTASTITDFSEAVDDRVAVLIVGGTNITSTYNDAANTLTISAAAYPTALPPSGAAGGDLGGTYPNPTVSPEVIDDRVAALLVAGTNITLSYNDPANTLTINSTASGGTGTVTSVSVVSANGLAGTVATPTAAAAITLSTTITASVLKGNGTAIQAAVAGTDYVSPGGLTTALGSYLPLVGGTLTGPGNLAVGGTLGVTGALTGTTDTMTGAIKSMSATAIPAGGTAGAGFTFSSTANFGTFFGSGAPTLSAAQGSLYLRSDGTPYYNTNGTTGWSAIGSGGGASISIGTTPPGSPSAGALWWNSDASSGGGALYLYFTDVNTSQWVPASPAATPGSLIQTVFTETGAVATGTTVIPLDDTIPQITEGNEYMTLAITPRSATSKLIINIIWNGGNSSAAATLMLALFQDSTANALATTWTSYLTNSAASIILRHSMTSGTTSATTFRVRVGSSTAGTTTFNGLVGARLFGGVMASSIVIQEVA